MFVLLSDLQLLMDNPVARLDNLAETQYGKFKHVVEWAKEHGAPVIQAGDFFDTPRSWHLLQRYMRLLTDVGADVFAVYGQHDVYMRSEKSKPSTALGILAEAGLVTILGRAPRVVGGVKLYGCHYGWKPDEQRKVQKSILAIHAPIVMHKLWAQQERYHYAPTFLRRYKHQVIVCGDIHRAFEHSYKERHIVNTGCLVRDTADKYNFTHKPGFYVWDSATNELWFEEVPHKPAAKVLSREHLQEEERLHSVFDEFFAKMEESEQERGDAPAVSFTDNLVDVAQEAGLGEDVCDLIAETMDEEVKWRGRNEGTT